MFGEACDAYLKHAERSAATIASVEEMRVNVGTGTLCDSIDQDMLDNLRDELLEEGSSAQSFKRRVVTPVKAILNFTAAKWGAKRGCPKPNFLPIPDGERRKVIVLPHEAEQIVSLSCKKGWELLATVVQFGACEGARRGEMFALDWSSVDLDRKRCTLRDTKSRACDERDRVIDDLRPRSVRALRALQARTGRPTGRVFVRDDGSPFPDVGSFGQAMNEQLAAVCRELKFADRTTLHVLRHSAASWHYRVDKDPEEVRARMDWRSVPNALRYIHLMPKGSEHEVIAFWEGQPACKSPG